MQSVESPPSILCLFVLPQCKMEIVESPSSRLRLSKSRNDNLQMTGYNYKRYWRRLASVRELNWKKNMLPCAWSTATKCLEISSFWNKTSFIDLIYTYLSTTLAYSTEGQNSSVNFGIYDEIKLPAPRMRTRPSPFYRPTYMSFTARGGGGWVYVCGREVSIY